MSKEKASRPSYYKTLASVLVSVLFLWYIYANRHSIFDIFAHLNVRYLVFIALLQAGVQFVNSSVFFAAVKALGQSSMTRMEAFRVTLVSSFVNFFTPVIGGASTKAVYLKQKHAIQYSSFIAVMYANYLISFFVSFVFGLMGVVLSGHVVDTKAGIIAAVFFSGGIISSLIFIVFDHKIVAYLSRYTFKSKLVNKLVKKVLLVTEGWIKIKTNKKALLSMLAHTLVATVFTVIIYLLVMKSLGISIKAWAAMLFAALANISLLFNVTPGNIGIRETIYASTFTITGITSQQIVAFSLLERSLLILLLGGSWIIFSRRILHQEKVVIEDSELKLS